MLAQLLLTLALCKLVTLWHTDERQFYLVQLLLIFENLKFITCTCIKLHTKLGLEEVQTLHGTYFDLHSAEYF